MFAIGEKVVCIDNTNVAEELVKNEIYTIDFIIPDENGLIGLVLNGFDPYAAYYSYRFRKLDYNFSDNLLEEITRSVLSEQLINT